jgi:Ig-like domain from next to BRCA1 gene
VPGDVSAFIRDVTYPDYSKVFTNERFTKIWELRDAGTVKWTGRYLAALGPSSGTCRYPPRVRIPTTDPGGTVDISVNVIASPSPGLCYVTWRMMSSNGVLYFPNDTEGIWFKVLVVAKRSS